FCPIPTSASTTPLQHPDNTRPTPRPHGCRRPNQPYGKGFSLASISLICCSIFSGVRRVASATVSSGGGFSLSQTSLGRVGSSNFAGCTPQIRNLRSPVTLESSTKSPAPEGTHRRNLISGGLTSRSSKRKPPSQNNEGLISSFGSGFPLCPWV